MEFAHHTGRRLGLLEVQLSDAVRARIIDDRGEGVISMAIAILIIAVIGAAMFAIFNGLATGAGNKAKEQIDSIGG